MGLCKCPRKKVTSLFCFEHRVNVCEHCLIQQHSQCVVQSYLMWLQDSDYDPNCIFCSKPYSDSPCVRLTCLHIFHWDCLNKHAHGLPQNTAPAGYRCPSPQCNAGLFPSPQQKSPIVDELKELLKTANWARAGIGLSLLPELEVGPIYNKGEDSAGNGQVEASKQTVVHVETCETTGMMARKVCQSQSDIVENVLSNTDVDENEHKYKRRPASEWLSRFLRSPSDTRGAARGISNHFDV